jgi:hypothetical protein
MQIFYSIIFKKIHLYFGFTSLMTWMTAIYVFYFPAFSLEWKVTFILKASSLLPKFSLQPRKNSVNAVPDL